MSWSLFLKLLLGSLVDLYDVSSYSRKYGKLTFVLSPSHSFQNVSHCCICFLPPLWLSRVFVTVQIRTVDRAGCPDCFITKLICFYARADRNQRTRSPQQRNDNRHDNRNADATWEVQRWIVSSRIHPI